jgi:RNA polymerase sigma-70 factor (ECF subfamily)
MESEFEIVRQCQKGNWSDFDKLYEVYLPKIYGFVYNRVRHKQTTEDIVSLVFTRAVEHITSFKGSTSSFSAWMYGIARNAVIDHYRKAKPTSNIEAAADAATKDDFASDVDRQLMSEQIRKSLQLLSSSEREIILMRIWDELSHQEIGQILNISEANSKVTYSRALANLRQKSLINNP